MWSNCFSNELHNIEEVGSFDEIKIKGNWNKYLRDVKRKYFLLKIFFFNKLVTLLGCETTNLGVWELIFLASGLFGTPGQ